MAAKMTIFGVGPRIVASGVATFVVAVMVTRHYHGALVIDFVPYPLLAAAGILLLAIAVAVKIMAGITVFRAFTTGKLATTGPYAWSRNPIYATYILLTVPAIALLFNAWLILAASAVMYLVFKLTIRKETAFLREKFGDDFTRHEASTNELLFRPPRKPHSA
jgi:protein-S-isoprenylcysteine O-methyltransferase Ste14